jgi:hypothetical protein
MTGSDTEAAEEAACEGPNQKKQKPTSSTTVATEPPLPPPSPPVELPRQLSWDNCTINIDVKAHFLPGHIGPDYIHEDPLGSGAFGEVAKCIHNRTGEPVTIKVGWALQVAHARSVLRELRVLRLVL